MFGLEFHSFRKNVALKEPFDNIMLHSGNCWDCQMALWADHFVDRTFRGSNWTPTEQLVKGSLYLINEQLENAV